MKNNFLVYLLTSVFAFLGFVFVLISFFKNKRLIWYFKNENSDLNLKKLDDLPDYYGDSGDSC